MEGGGGIKQPRRLYGRAVWNIERRIEEGGKEGGRRRRWWGGGRVRVSERERGEERKRRRSGKGWPEGSAAESSLASFPASLNQASSRGGAGAAGGERGSGVGGVCQLPSPPPLPSQAGWNARGESNARRPRVSTFGFRTLQSAKFQTGGGGRCLPPPSSRAGRAHALLSLPLQGACCFPSVLLAKDKELGPAWKPQVFFTPCLSAEESPPPHPPPGPLLSRLRHLSLPYPATSGRWKGGGGVCVVEQ